MGMTEELYVNSLKYPFIHCLTLSKVYKLIRNAYSFPIFDCANHWLYIVHNFFSMQEWNGEKTIGNGTWAANKGRLLGTHSGYARGLGEVMMPQEPHTKHGDDGGGNLLQDA